VENIFTNINLLLPKYEWLAYFLVDFLYLFAVIVNSVIFAFFRKKTSCKRLSDIFTSSVFLLNSIILFVLTFFLNSNSLFDLANGAFIINKEAFILKLAVSIFLLFFIMITYKLVRKIKYKAGLINAILCSIALISSALAVSSNPLLSFILLDAVVFLIYEYASCMRVRENTVYSLEFLLISVSASTLFYVFYAMRFFAENSLLLNVLHICIIASAMLKIGIFPIYNYTINKNYKVNLPYNILLFTLMPFLGYFAFKDVLGLFPNVEDFATVLASCFASLALFMFALNAFKTKNLIALFANISYFYISLLFLSLLINVDSFVLDNLAYMNLFVLLGIFSLFSVVQINTHVQKIKQNALKGLFLNSPLCAMLYSVLALCLVCVIPSGMLFRFQEILKSVYIFDVTGLYFAALIFLSLILIVFNVISSIVKVYYFTKEEFNQKYTKRTTFNYVVPFVIILFLISQIF